MISAVADWHLGTIAQLCRAMSLQLRHVSTIGKKLIKQHYLLQMSPQYYELRPTNGWDQLASWGHPSKFQRVSRFGFVTTATSLTGGQPNLAWCLAVSWAGTLFIHFWGCCPLTEFLQVQNSLYIPSLACFYIGSITTQHSSSGHQAKFAACYKEWNYGTFAEGATYIWLGIHHVGHRPTF